MLLQNLIDQLGALKKAVVDMKEQKEAEHKQTGETEESSALGYYFRYMHLNYLSVISTLRAAAAAAVLSSIIIQFVILCNPLAICTSLTGVYRFLSFVTKRHIQRTCSRRYGVIFSGDEDITGRFLDDINLAKKQGIKLEDLLASLAKRGLCPLLRNTIVTSASVVEVALLQNKYK